MPQFARPNSTVAAGTWVAEPITGALWEAIDEALNSDSDYMRTSTNSTAQIGLSTVNDPLSSNGHTVRLRAYSTGSGAPERLTVTLRQGTTVIATVLSSQNLNRGTPSTLYTYTLTQLEADNITDYGNLRIYFSSENVAATESVTVTWAEFEVPNVLVTNTRTHSFNSLIKRTQTRTHSFLSVLRATVTRTHSFNSIIRLTVTKTHHFDAAISQRLDRTHHFDAIVRLTTSKSHSFDSLLRATQTRTHALGSVLLQTFTKTHAFDASKKLQPIVTNSLDSLLLAQLTTSHSFDVAIQTVQTLTHSFDSLVTLQVDLTHAFDAVLVATATRTHSFDSVVLLNASLTHSIETLAQRTASTTHAFDSRIQDSVITAQDVIIRLSTKDGTAGDQNPGTPNGSLGKYMSQTDNVDNTLHNLFDEITPSEASGGDIEYRCVFIFNAHTTETLYSVRVWIDSEVSGGADAAIGLDTTTASIKNDTDPQAIEVADEGTAPSGVTFSSPTTIENSLLVGDLSPEFCRAVWVRRTANNDPLGNDGVTLRIQGTN